MSETKYSVQYPIHSIRIVNGVVQVWQNWARKVSPLDFNRTETATPNLIIKVNSV